MRAQGGDEPVPAHILEVLVPDGFAPNPEVESFRVDLTLKEFDFQRPTSEAKKARMAALAEAETEYAAAVDAAKKAAEKSDKDYKAPPRPAILDEEEEEEVIPPSHFLAARYNRDDPSRFYVTLAGSDKEDGGLHTCSFGVSQPISTIPAHSTELGGNGAVMQYSKSGHLFLTSGIDASIIVRHTSELNKFVAVRVHNSAFGGVSGVALSFDERFLLSAGRDNQILVTQFDKTTLGKVARGEVTDTAAVSPLNAQAVREAAAAAAAVKLVEPKGGPPEVPDITSNQAYSIEQSKSKTEEDRRRADADAKKAVIRKQVEELRAKMDALLTENAALPKDAQLSLDRFTIHEDMRNLFLAIGKGELEEVQKRMERDTVKADIQLVKIRTKFLDSVAVESLTLKAFNSKHRVSTFRQPNLSEEMEAELQSIVERKGAQLAELASEDDLETKAADRDADSSGVAAAGLAETVAAQPGKKDESSWGKRKAMRKLRLAALREVESRKPDPDDDDVADVRAIDDAVQNLGDYKLKTSADYVVPKEQRTDADLKKQEILLQRFEIYKTKSEFNGRWLALRRVKRDIVAAIKLHSNQISQLTVQIGDDNAEAASLASISMDLDEWADHRATVSDQDVARFKTEGSIQLQDIPESVHVGDGLPLHSKGAGSGGINGEGIEESKLSLNDTANTTNAATTRASQLDFLSSAPGMLSAMGFARALHSEIQTAEVPADGSDAHLRLLHQRRQFLIDRARGLMAKFDEELLSLWEEKPYLEAALSNEELRFLTMREELLLLRSFQASDASLSEKLNRCRQDKAKLEKQLQDVGGKLKLKQGDVDNLKRQEEALVEEFLDLVGGDQAKLYKPLYKIFRRKIKRTKDGEESQDEQEEEQESDSDLDSDSDDDDDDDDEEEVCPAGCEVEVYETVKQLRERRLDHEELLVDTQKQHDELKKMHDRLSTRLKQANKDISGTIADIQTSQAEKQREMNAFSTSVAIKTSQMCCIFGGVDDSFQTPQLPDTVDNCLVFNRFVYQRMKERFKELLVEKKQQSTAFKELQRRQRKLEGMRKKKKVEVAALDARCVELQIMKFGAVIDLDDLENSTTNSTVQKLQAKIKKQEASQAAQLSKMRRAVKDKEQELMRFTAANTRILQETSALTERMHRLEKGLNTTAGAGEPVSNNDPAAKKDAEERRKLVHLVRLQAREVDALKAEIMMLRRKGGHIYANYSSNNRGGP